MTLFEGETLFCKCGLLLFLRDPIFKTFPKPLTFWKYRVGIEHTEGDSPNPYAVATAVKPAPVQEEPEPAPPAESSSDSD